VTGVLATLSAYDAVPVEALADACGGVQVVALAECGSTMDVAHALAADGAGHGTVIVAEAQAAGRGRSGKQWHAAAAAGVWCSVVVRDPVGRAPGVLSLRTGLELAARLDRHAGDTVQLKWPNDLFLGGRKLAGILTEARWRGDQLEWMVVGVGVNLRAAQGDLDSAALPSGTRHSAVLVDVARAVRSAADGGAALSEDEIHAFSQRDLAAGRAVVAPLEGIVLGLDAHGGLRVRTATADAVAIAGSLVFRSTTGE
jgi:BirA family transcriptional regulator, biotin operon repressor / biotin---[acetyl-CoA-carboxylase] ligase